ncbi:hypothetical protein Hdeb2414_s0029g00707001 [Helianthus debilis subsp. tardiflorus]
MELMESAQAEVPIKELPVMNSENLAALIESLKESLGNPPSEIAPTQEEQVEDDCVEDTHIVSRKRQRVDPEPCITDHVSPIAETEPVTRTEPEVKPTVSQEEVILDFFESASLETTTRAEPESSSGFRFDVVGSSSGDMSKYEENLLQAAEKMKFIEDFDSDDDTHVDVVNL